MVAEGSAVVAAAASETAFSSKAAVGIESVVDFVIVAVAVGEQLAAYLTFASENQETYWNSGQWSYSQNFAQVVECSKFG